MLSKKASSKNYKNINRTNICLQRNQDRLFLLNDLNVRCHGEFTINPLPKVTISTEFQYQKLKVKPVKGKMVIWPTDFTHFHRGITSPTQDKYIATGWLNFFDVVDFQKLVK